MSENDVRDNDALRRLLQRVDTSYPRGWYVAVSETDVIAASADFHELEGMLVARGHDPSDTVVVEAGATRPEYLTIFL